ncbi:MAG: tetratricopeptide repeat protein, partial [Holophaga sp.]|nr:tetratricopeptide repeat protein [Holophaga sp.]
MIWDTLLMALREIQRNPMRSSLTMLGIVIGVASVIIMVALGRSAAASITAQISNMGTNLLVASPGSEHRGPTSSTARPFSQEDARVVVRELKGLAVVAPAGSQGALLVNGNVNWNSTVTGSTNSYFQVRAIRLESGQVFSEAQMQSGAAVCVLGATVRARLFGLQDPIGSSIRIGKIAFEVTGVARSKGKASIGQDPDDSFTRYALALELAKEGRDRDAADQLQELISRESKYVPAYYHLGRILSKMGLTLEARDILTRGM